MAEHGWLHGKRVMVLEDEYVLAFHLAEQFEAAGAEVVGPFAAVDEALEQIERESPDAAVLDVNLGGKQCFPVADALQARGVPYVFASGYDRSTLPARYSNVPHCTKPVDADGVEKALVGLVAGDASRRGA